MFNALFCGYNTNGDIMKNRSFIRLDLILFIAAAETILFLIVIKLGLI
jgi:hypothetical protein